MTTGIEQDSLNRYILVIEDNPNHAQQIEAALTACSLQYQVKTIADGGQALDFLRRSGVYGEAPRPDLVLLNLNLSNADGKTVLLELKADPLLRRLPIVILTTSDDNTEVFKCYELQGNCYVIKSGDLEQLGAIVRRIEEFWLRIVTLPTK